MQLDHINLYVSDLSKSKIFYEAIFQSSDIKVIRDVGNIAVGFGRTNYAELALVLHDGIIQKTHFAFRTETREQIDMLYSFAIEAGASCNGEPGLRTHYHEHYYGAFVLDPDGHNLEFVCHNPI